MEETTKLWSRRWTTSYGWVWKLERECFISTADEWLTVFKKGEPTIEFKLSKKKPK